MISIMFNKNFPYKKLRKLFAIAIVALFIQNIFLWINAGFDSGFIFVTCFMSHAIIVGLLLASGVLKKPKGDYDINFYDDLDDVGFLCISFSLVAGILGFLAFIGALKVAQSYSVSLIIFYGLNFVQIAIWSFIRVVLGNVLEEIYKINEFKKGTDVEYEVRDIKSKYKEIYNGLNDMEIGVVKPALSNIYNLWKGSFNIYLKLTHPKLFWETLDFLNNAVELMDTYKKSKIEMDLDFLKRLNNSAEEFYSFIYKKEQALREEELKVAMEVFEIKSQKAN